MPDHYDMLILRNSLQRVSDKFVIVAGPDTLKSFNVRNVGDVWMF